MLGETRIKGGLAINAKCKDARVNCQGKITNRSNPRFGKTFADLGAQPFLIVRLIAAAVDEPPHRVQQLLVLRGSVVAGQRDLDRQLGEIGQELVQRRVQQPDGDRQPVHRLEEGDEVQVGKYKLTFHAR